MCVDLSMCLCGCVHVWQWGSCAASFPAPRLSQRVPVSLISASSGTLSQMTLVCHESCTYSHGCCGPIPFIPWERSPPAETQHRGKLRLRSEPSSLPAFALFIIGHRWQQTSQSIPLCWLTASGICWSKAQKFLHPFVLRAWSLLHRERRTAVQRLQLDPVQK